MQIQVIKKMLKNLEYKEIPLLDSPEKKKSGNKKDLKDSKVSKPEESNDPNAYKPVTEEPFLIDFMKDRPKDEKQEKLISCSKMNYMQQWLIL